MYDLKQPYFVDIPHLIGDINQKLKYERQEERRTKPAFIKESTNISFVFVFFFITFSKKLYFNVRVKTCNTHSIYVNISIPHYREGSFLLSLPKSAYSTSQNCRLPPKQRSNGSSPGTWFPSMIKPALLT